MAEQRALRVEQMLAAMDSPMDPQVVYTSVWMEAFKSGVEFQKRRDRSQSSEDSPRS